MAMPGGRFPAFPIAHAGKEIGMDIGGIGGHGSIYKLVFEKAEADESGGLNLQEFTAVAENYARSQGRPELADILKQTFDAIDTDKSGEISVAELKDHVKELRQQFHDERREDDERRHRGLVNRVGLAFLKGDKDDSGGLNLAELASLAEQRAERTGDRTILDTIEETFNRIDTSGNGEISPRELLTYLQEIHFAKHHGDEAAAADGAPAEAAAAPGDTLLTFEAKLSLLTAQETSETGESGESLDDDGDGEDEDD